MHRCGCLFICNYIYYTYVKVLLGVGRLTAEEVLYLDGPIVEEEIPCVYVTVYDLLLMQCLEATTITNKVILDNAE
jgi:hypothetical protein